MSVESRIDDLIALSERLDKLLARETELIKGRKPQEIAAFSDEKAHVAALYAREMRDFKGDIAGAKNLPAAKIEKLKTITGHLRETIAAHSRLLTRLRRVSEGLIKTIADDVAAKRAPTLGYGPGATYATPRKPQTAAIVVNDVA
jgi:hypothetical protein